MRLGWNRQVLTLVLALFGGSLLWAQTPPATPVVTAPATAPAARPVVSASGLHCQDMALSRVIDYLRQATGANIVVRWKVLEAAGITRETPISLEVDRITFRKALRLVLDQASPSTVLTWIVADNVLTITTRDDADKEMLTRVYVVSDLVTPPMTLPPAPSFSLANSTSNSGTGGGGGSSGQSPFGQTTDPNSQLMTPEKMGNDLVELITSVIRPEVWTKNGGQSAIRYFSGKLIVTAPLSVHEAIGGPYLTEGTK